jgi:ethanolaminephosphotransferase
MVGGPAAGGVAPGDGDAAQTRARLPLSLLVMMEWTGRSGYFALGNSNSIATINVSKAFTGLSDYDYTLCGLFTALITFSGPLLLWYSTISALYSLVRRRSHGGQQHERVWLSGTLLTAASIHTSMRIVCLTGACVVAVIFRNHLFVWSVFSPKLLYELVFSVTMLAAHAVALLAAAGADLVEASLRRDAHL